MILFSGFPSLSTKHSELMETHLGDIYCLHVFGENDKVSFVNSYGNTL